MQEQEGHLLEYFLYETNQQLGEIEELVLKWEREGIFNEESINEIFRVMHTIKGSAAIMNYKAISEVAHHLEDLFSIIKKKPNGSYNAIPDVVLKGIDYIKAHLKQEVSEGIDQEGNNLIILIQEIFERLNDNNAYSKLALTKRSFTGLVFFDEGAAMENVRSFMLVQKLLSCCSKVNYEPMELLEHPELSEVISKNGFRFTVETTLGEEGLKQLIEEALYIKNYTLKEEAKNTDTIQKAISTYNIDNSPGLQSHIPLVIEGGTKQTLVSVQIEKLDRLMDFVGEIVIAETMVLQHPEIKELDLPGFRKAARQMIKLTDELQDITMSIRMMPMTTLFNKMERLIRDTSKKLGKKIKFISYGMETEVDKNILDQLGDPLMHLIRNAIDHGIEFSEARQQQRKPEEGTIILSAENTGGEILIQVKDDGKGIDLVKIREIAEKRELIKPGEDIGEKEMIDLILMPGFSTKDKVTELSGRGVGLDVVKQHIEALGGTIQVKSQVGEGTTFFLRIPLTLAIIKGIKVSVGDGIYTLPIHCIQAIFKADLQDIFKNQEDQYFMTLRGKIYPVALLYQLLGEVNAVTDLAEGIMLLIEDRGQAFCLFVDALIGEQQVVIKALPTLLEHYHIRKKGIGGCVILGDGSMSLVLEVSQLLEEIGY